VDVKVAVRLHLTGHSGIEIEPAVRQRAPAHRPSEERDWEAYARRAADHAFGPSGAPELKRLERVREDLFRLEAGAGESSSSALTRLSGEVWVLGAEPLNWRKQQSIANGR
jgi:hypothetical protein